MAPGQPLLAGDHAQMRSVTEPSVGKDFAQTMVEQIVGTTSHAEALKTLRAAFPGSPLTVRVAALVMLTRRGANDPPHIPR
jgi:hypothetical protein